MTEPATTPRQDQGPSLRVSIAIALLAGIPATIFITVFSIVANGRSFNFIGVIVLYIGSSLVIALLVHTIRSLLHVGTDERRHGGDATPSSGPAPEIRVAGQRVDATKAGRSMTSATVLALLATVLIEVFGMGIVGLSFDIFRIIFVFVVLSFAFGLYLYSRRDTARARDRRAADPAPRTAPVTDQDASPPPRGADSAAALRMSKPDGKRK